MERESCRLAAQGFKPGACFVWCGDERLPACRATLRWEDGVPYRLIHAAHLSRPEHYFSIYQSGCNLSCLKCHSWEFTQYAQGIWMSPDDIAHLALRYSEKVTFREPRERATAFHALDICKGCGTCVKLEPAVGFEEGRRVTRLYLKESGIRSPFCPRVLDPKQIILSPQGFGPARNIIAFTGGDLGCQPEFYALSAERIKNLDKGLWVLFETNGYGLTPATLDLLRSAGVDSLWLDIKAYNKEVHRRLTGVDNDWILKLPEEILKRDFVLEVLSLYIPGWVEEDQIGKIAELLAKIDPEIPFTILAFFPQYKLSLVPPPNLDQMLAAYEKAREAGLRNVRLGNPSVFIKTAEDRERVKELAPEAI